MEDLNETFKSVSQNPGEKTMTETEHSSNLHETSVKIDIMLNLLTNMSNKTSASCCSVNGNLKLVKKIKQMDTTVKELKTNM